jgi:heat shock protein HslJ
MVRAGRPPHRTWSAVVISVLVAASAALAGCGAGTGAGAGAEEPDLAGRTFTSSEVRGHSLVDGTTVRLSFEEDTISAQAGCNTIFGSASWDDDVLTTDGPLAMTMMACDDGLSEQDEWLSSFLTSEPAITFEGDTLVLGTDSEGITLTQETS